MLYYAHKHKKGSAKMKNVVAYIRVSTDGQVGEDKFGLEAQRQQILDYFVEILTTKPKKMK